MFLSDKNLMPSPVVAPEAFTLASLIAWLETQDGETKYDAGCRDTCLICRFASAVSGHRLTWVAANRFLKRNSLALDGLSYAAHATFDSNISTYAKALTRARSYADGVK